jgi:hypothetical protein
VKILIGNHIDPAIRDRGDLRAWTQRVLWFARDGDAVVLCCDADPEFLAYATALTGTDPQSLAFFKVPEGDHGEGLVDPRCLASPQFAARVTRALGRSRLDGAQEVFALWPSASVSALAARLGIGDRFPGAGFFSQGGGELCNSKAVFRALAAAAGVPVPRGAVCRSPREAEAATRELLAARGGVVVKQAHNGAGAGNQLVVQDPALALDHAGARHLHQLGDGPDPVGDYWARQWGWASAGGRFPVVVEELVPHVVSAYSEHHASDAGTVPTGAGTLHYARRRLARQAVPLAGPAAAARGQLLDGGTRLAGAYRALGYRGYLSADAVITPDGQAVFTEVNAQVSGSLHIYQVIAGQVVRAGGTPERTVAEYHSPATWTTAGLREFLAAASDLGCAWDPAARTGVIASMPLIPGPDGRAMFLFCVAGDGAAGEREALARLAGRFAINAGGAALPALAR